jgi:hypothetical protein
MLAIAVVWLGLIVLGLADTGATAALIGKVSGLFGARQ